ncbi:MAG TPA: cyclopropane-fatty-acyl-phospholipid synthase family protein [Roseiarcus sp.]|nr:cyclopropane-fatty-acyl-phospholipid synthase family protein [Roseiarcus sp.]
MSAADRRLEALRALAAKAHEQLALEFGIRLWDGSYVPTDWPPSGLTIAIADEGAIAGIIRRRNPVTIANLWAAKRLDILNGTIFDLVARRPKIHIRQLWSPFNGILALKTALSFLLVSRGGPWPLETIGKDRESDGSAEQNKRNIAHHYDLSNKFYEMWLDREMVYTCSYFHDWSDDLDTTQIQKLDMCCRKLRLKPGEYLYDMGCGWGALSCYAARNYGVKCYGATLSEQQVAYANEKIKRLGLTDRVTIECKDYAAIEGVDRFDKVAAIGMLEHVGIENFPTYFKTVHRVLKPGGLFLHHAITRPGKSHSARTGKKRADFAALTRYIFPGGELDYIGRTVTNLERHGFEIHDVEGWREHYQRTCRMWHDRLLERYDEACQEVGEVNTRIWLAYLAACSITFERNNAGLYQTLASKRVKGSVGLPPTRADLYR